MLPKQPRLLLACGAIQVPPALKAPKGNQDLKVFKANQAPKGLRGRLALRGPRERLDRKDPKGKLGPKGPRVRLVLRDLRARSARKENRVIQVPRGLLELMADIMHLMLTALEISVGLQARPECLLWQVRTSEGLKDPLAQTERQTVISP